jgi:hypothetical protein
VTKGKKHLLFPIWELFAGFFEVYSIYSIAASALAELFRCNIPKRRIVFVALPDEPEGWQTLQAMAQQESDPVKLAAIIDQMNSLLCWYERRPAAVERNTYDPERLPETKLREMQFGAGSWGGRSLTDEEF